MGEEENRSYLFFFFALHRCCHDTDRAALKTVFICSQCYTPSSSIIWIPQKYKHLMALSPWCPYYGGLTVLNTGDILFTFLLITVRMEFSLHVNCFWSLQSGNILPVESGNVAFGIHNSTQGTLKPTNIGIWNPSATHWESRIQHLEFGIHSTEFRIQSCL